MQVYPSDKVRNIALIAHGGAGKTSLAEAMLFNSGSIKRLGKVDEGNTTTDFQPEEIKRKLTCTLALAPCQWHGYKINILDTPGYSDFIGEVKSGLRVADTGVVVVCAVAGVEVQTEVVWEYAAEQELPRMVFINKMERENANFYRVLEQMQNTFKDNNVVPLQLPIGSADSFTGVVDVLKQKAYFFKNGKVETGEVPAEMSSDLASYHEKVVEAAAENDDDLLTRYLEGEELNLDEIKLGLQKGIQSAKLVPVFCGSALQNLGVDLFMDNLVNYVPAPLAKEGETESELSAKPLAALVFKTISDPYVGKLNLFRVYQGVMKGDSVVYNSNKEADERIGQVLILSGKNQESVDEIRPGDIGAVAKFQVTSTGDTLTVKNNPQKLEGIQFPQPSLPVAVVPKSKGDEDKIGSALSRLMEEDTTLKLEKNTETKQTILTGMGEMHLDITVERLQRKFGAGVVLEDPKVPYRETIRTAVNRIEGKHKKQSGGHGQFGHVYIDMAPLPDQEFLFEESIFGGSVPKQYIPAVEKGIREALTDGILAGYPVTNVRVNLIDGSYHPVDSSEMAFKIASSLAFRKAMEKAKPVMMEPIMNVEVRVPDQFMGDIIGDLNSKRGRILGMEADGKHQVIKAQVPLSEMYRYAIDLKAITQGRGTFQMSFSQYEEMPSNLADKIIEAAKTARAAEEK